MLHQEEFNNYTDNIGSTAVWIVTHSRSRSAGHAVGRATACCADV
jgi:hypothetical protein